MTAQENLQRLGITLPEPPAARGNYVPWIRTGNLIMTSGQLPLADGVMKYTGRVGEDLTTEQGFQAARLAAINAIAQLLDATGDLEKIATLIRLEGNVLCGEGLEEHPQVLNVASDLFVEIFEERGKHTRTALGIRDMPLNATVQLCVFAEVQS